MIRIVWPLLLLLSLFFATPAQSYISIKHGPQQQETIWSNPAIKWWMDVGAPPGVSESDALSALQAAFDSWEAVNCSEASFIYMGKSGSPQNDSIYLNFEPDEWDPSVDGAAAFTVSEKKWGGNIKYSIIVFNAVDITWSTNAAESDWGLKSDLQGVASHEIGHALGLDHPWIRSATMFYSGGTSELRSLDPDDERGACYLYPTGTFNAGLVCDSCQSNGQCSNGVCLGYPNENGNGFCGADCSSDGDCPNQFDCVQVTGVGGQCVPTYEYCTHFGSNVPLGGYCWGNQMCSSGQCIPLPGDAYCTQSCNTNSASSCTAGYKCLGSGSSGYCLKVGDKALGESCEAPLECATALCYAGLCTVECGVNDACPDGTSCFMDHCFPPGAKNYGEECDSHLDCQTQFCAGLFEKFCSYECTSNDDCPSVAECLPAGYCSDLQLAAKGDICQEDSACLPGLTCIMDGPGAFGHCHSLCDPFLDTGCGGADECAWFYEPGTGTIKGGCIDAGGGGKHREGCGGDLGDCQDHLICAALTSIEGKCVRDCRVSDSYGCESWEDCFPLNDPSDPQHGACVSNGSPPPPPPPTDAGSVPDDQGVGTDPGTSMPPVDTTTTTDSSPPPPAPPESSSGGCTTSNTSTPLMPLTTMVLCLFSVLLVRRLKKRKANE